MSARADSLCEKCVAEFRSIAGGLVFMGAALEDVPEAELNGEFAALIALEEPMYVF